VVKEAEISRRGSRYGGDSTRNGSLTGGGKGRHSSLEDTIIQEGKGGVIQVEGKGRAAPGMGLG